MVNELCRFLWVLGVAGLTGPAAAVAQEARTGSGFFVNTQGWLVTNAHVVDGCGAVEVDGVRAVSVVVAEGVDLAAVHAPQPGGNSRLTLRLTPARLAEPVVLLGYPLPEVLSEGIKVTLGEVNAERGPSDDRRYVQISAPAQAGNSGGPVLDEFGIVVGVFAATLGEEAYDRAQNVNFAVTVEEVARFLDRADVTFRGLDMEPGVLTMLGGPTITERAAEAAEAVALVRCLP